MPTKSITVCIHTIIIFPSYILSLPPGITLLAYRPRDISPLAAAPVCGFHSISPSSFVDEQDDKINRTFLSWYFYFRIVPSCPSSSSSPRVFFPSEHHPRAIHRHSPGKSTKRIGGVSGEGWYCCGQSQRMER